MDQIDLKLKKAKKLDVGASKIGGKPSVPPKFTWPESEYGGPLGFVLQLNFAELQAAKPTKKIPTKGVLQLFCTLDESDLSSGSPEHAIRFHENASKLVEADFPEEYDETEGTLEQRSITFGAKGEARMFGDAPELGEELDGSFDEDEEEVLLELDAYGNVTRVDESHSIFGEGRFVLVVKSDALAEGNLEGVDLLFVGGT
jgi:hypothetical protein